MIAQLTGEALVELSPTLGGPGPRSRLKSTRHQAPKTRNSRQDLLGQVVFAQPLPPRSR
jgi:hypothetical protein